MRLVSTVLTIMLFATALGVGLSPGAVSAQDEATAPTVAPGTVVVDELSDGFRQRGGGWRSASFGYARHHYWLPASRTLRHIGIWTATLPESGLYRVMAKLPGRHASARAAVYKIKSASGWQQRVRSQYKNRGGWLSLGIHRFGTSAEVRLADRTGDPRGTNRKLAFDAIKFVPVVPPPAPVIARLVVDPGIDQAVVTFSLDKPGPAKTQYRETGSISWITGVNETSSTADHRHVIRGLTPETDYELRVIATNLGGKTISPVVAFTTLAPPPPPTITDLDVDPRHDRAIVTFSLDQPGPARTQYRRAGASEWLLGANEASSKYADHRQVIRDLKPLTDYELRVIATNDWGRAISPVVGFRTLAPPPPVISNIVVKPEEFRAVVTFSLDEAGPARTEYRKAGTTEWLLVYDQVTPEYKDHREVIRELAPETEYEVRIIATNAGGRTVSDIVPFKTKRRTVDCDQGEDLQDAIAEAKSGDTLIINGFCTSSAQNGGKDLTLQGGSNAFVAGIASISTGTRLTLLGLGVGDGRPFGTNRGRLVLKDCNVFNTDPGIENAPGASMLVERTKWIGDGQVIQNYGIYEAVDSYLAGGDFGDFGINNYSTGTMTIRRSQIGGTYTVLLNYGGTVVLDTVMMERVDGAYYDPISNSGKMTIRDSRFVGNWGDPASVVGNSGTLAISDTLIKDNVCYSDTGGAIVNTGDITLRNVTFSNNKPTDCVGC